MGAHELDTDVAIVGSGFAGSLTALALRKLGRRVAMIERGRHPRFAIGESSTPLANLLIEELADRYDLPRIRSFSKWGTWQRERPEIACGLKRGFTFFFHELGRSFPDDPDHQRQLLVAASPHDDIADLHWYRPEFDHALVADAQDAGAEYLDDTRLDRVRQHDGRTVLEGERAGRPVAIRARFVVDASGPRGFLWRTLQLGEAPRRWLPPTAGLYTHFDGVARWDEALPSTNPPYPVDDAALHHVFPGGWIWVLRFNNGLTSAGAALTDPTATRVRASDGAAAWTRLMAELPSVAEQFHGARATLPFVYAPRLSFRSCRVAGPSWALLPSAAGVIDPLLSTGFPLTLLGILRLLRILETTSDGADREHALAEYERRTTEELDATERLVAALYATMDVPVLFKRLSLLYFAAASFSEGARRLARPHLAPGFLLCRHPAFAPALEALSLEALSGAARRDPAGLIGRIDRAIEPFDIAGLADRGRGDWFPVLGGDFLASASKVGASEGDVLALLERMGMADRSHGR